MIAVVAACALLQSAPPADPDEVFVSAKAAYDKGDFAQAAELYAELAATIDNGHLMYNLGNASLRSGDLGAAVAAYLESQSLLPRDPDVRANLAFSRQATKDAVERKSSAVLRTLFFWHYVLSKRELLQATVLFGLLFWALLTLRLYRPGSEIARWLSWIAAVLLVATASSVSLRLALPTRVAVVQSGEVDVHSGTSRDTVVRFKLHAGTEVDWLDTQGSWLRIALPDKEQGWVHSEDMQALVL